jgi:hypothetical protein
MVVLVVACAIALPFVAHAGYHSNHAHIAQSCSHAV